jgi:serine/threonine-protein kinase RsbW
VNERRVSLSFPARAEYLLLPRLALAGIARGVEFPEEVLADLKLAVTEACGNAVRHAYTEVSPDHLVRVTIAVEDGNVRITVEDDGVGLGGNGALADSRLEGEGGMGLSIIEAIADDLTVGPASDSGGTLVVMRKSLAAESHSTTQ